MLNQWQSRHRTENCHNKSIAAVGNRYHCLCLEAVANARRGLFKIEKDISTAKVATGNDHAYYH